MLIIILFTLFLIFFILTWIYINKYNILKNNLVDKYDKNIEEYLIKKEKEKKEKEKALNDELCTIQDRIDREKSRADELQEQLDKRVDAQLQIEKEELKTRLLIEETKIRVDLDNQTQIIKDQQAAALEELSFIKQQLAEYQAKRQVINEEIRRERELALDQDAHRILLSDADKSDIRYLISIVENLRHPEILYKLIWSEYLIKPFQSMIKHSFGANPPSSVIYCIQTLDGKCKYIGKTAADVSKRWTEHVKTSLNIGGVSRSKIHDALFLHWDEFTFTVLEQVPREQLSQREKFYIDFFESDKYGFNIKSGG